MQICKGPKQTITIPLELIYIHVFLQNLEEKQCNNETHTFYFIKPRIYFESKPVWRDSNSKVSKPESDQNLDFLLAFRIHFVPSSELDASDVQVAVIMLER